MKQEKLCEIWMTRGGKADGKLDLVQKSGFGRKEALILIEYLKSITESG